MNRLRYQQVAVGVIFDKERGFLLPFNEKWKQYAFPMKKTSNEDAAKDVVAALRSDIRLNFPSAVAQPVDRVGAFGQSGRTGESAYYDYSVFLVDVGEQRSGSASASEAKYFPYEQLMASEEVTWSTKDVAEALVQNREVALAVIVRKRGARSECLMVHGPGGYFLPSTRRKTGDSTEDFAMLAVHQDTGYAGTVKARWHAEYTEYQTSKRFGERTTAFRFHLCPVMFPDMDVDAEENELEDALRKTEEQRRVTGFHSGEMPYSRWVCVDDLDHAEGLSSTARRLAAAIRAASSGAV